MLDTNKTVFISYRRSVSSFIARAVFMDLRANGYDVFMDVETIDSGEFDRIILNQIAARAHFVVILTPGSVERCFEPGDWLRREMEEAIRLQRNIVPLLVNGFCFNAETEKYLTGTLSALGRYSALPIYHEYFEEAMERLRTRFLKQPIQGSITPAPTTDQPSVQQRLNILASQPKPTDIQLNAEEYYNRAWARWLVHDWRGVIADCSEALRINPHYARAYSRRSGAKLYLKDQVGALADANHALSLSADDPYAYTYRGIVHYENNQLDDAIADFQEAVRHAPRLMEGYLNLGNAYFEKGDYEAAVSSYSRAISLDAQLSEAYLNRGDALRATGDRDGAITNYQKYLDLDGGQQDGNRTEVEAWIQVLRQAAKG